MTLEDYLRQDSVDYPDKIAVICGEEELTYSELYSKVLERSAQIPREKIITFLSSQSIDFLITYFAIHLAGSVAAPLEKNTPDSLFRSISESLGKSRVPEGSADILYTTGTTGRSKGVIISHRAIIADAGNLIEGQGFSHELVFIINGPLNHIGSLSKIYPVIMLGATLYIIDGMKDMNMFFHALDYPAAKMATFFVPANIRMLLQFSAERLAAYSSKIDFIESGAAPLAHADMLRLCQLLPHTRLYNTYASTETGVIATYNFNDGLCQNACLGRPLSNSRILIDQSGLIACQGDTLMSGYVNDEVMTSSVMREGTVFTSDTGYIDAEGMLHLTGRESDVINVGGYKVAPTEVENAAMSLPEVKDCICISVPHPITGNALKLLVVLSDGFDFDKRRIATHLSSTLETYKVPMLYELTSSIKRTYNGKTDRKFYQKDNN